VKSVNSNSLPWVSAQMVSASSSLWVSSPLMSTSSVSKNTKSCEFGSYMSMLIVNFAVLGQLQFRFRRAVTISLGWGSKGPELCESRTNK